MGGRAARPTSGRAINEINPSGSSIRRRYAVLRNIMAMEIRPAHSSDAEAVNELLCQLGYAQADRAATAARIRTWLDDPGSAVYVADVGGEVHGVIAAHVCPFFERDGASGRITALVVSDPARGRGIGSRLVEAAETFAASNGCVRMEVTSADRRSDAHAFYRGRGYADQTGTSSRFLRDLDTVQVGA